MAPSIQYLVMRTQENEMSKDPYAVPNSTAKPGNFKSDRPADYPNAPLSRQRTTRADEAPETPVVKPPATEEDKLHRTKMG
jgi:hypothetical protein